MTAQAITSHRTATSAAAQARRCGALHHSGETRGGVAGAAAAGVWA